MPATRPSQIEQPDFAAWIAALLKRHYASISATVAALAPFAGIVNLAAYTRHIGRPDVFMPSLELGPGLILLWLAYALFFAVLIGSMLITSLFMSWGIGFLRPKPDYAASLVRILTAVTAASMLLVIALVVLTTLLDCEIHPGYLSVILVPPGFASWFFLTGNVHSTESLKGDLKSWKMFLACIALTGWVGLTAIFGIYPAWFVTKFYEERGATGGWGEALFFCFIAMLGSLAPAIGYFNLAQKGWVAQVKAAIFGLVFFIGVLILMVPSLFSFPSVVAIKFLGISDHQVKRYLVSNDEYPADSLNAKRWAITHSEEKKYLLQGFPLYSYGAVTLLCPADVAQFKEQEIDQHTAQCIPFARSALRPLDGVVEMAKKANGDAGKSD
ncbi:hypothetical protein QA447_05555 [Pseudomonas sp. abacavir_1]